MASRMQPLNSINSPSCEPTAPPLPPSPSFSTSPPNQHRASPSTTSFAGPALGHQRIPTGTAAEPLNIVILGASFAGLSCAHAFLDDTITQLRQHSTPLNYRLVLISPSTHIYWNIGAPRALVRSGLLKHEDAFIAIEPGFHRHRGHVFTIVQGEAVSLDPFARTVTIDLFSYEAQKRVALIQPRRPGEGALSQSPFRDWASLPRQQTLSYHALICCTGSSSHSDLLSLHGPHLSTVAALDDFHAQVAQANSIVICGGGPSGVETAGQLATYLNFKSCFLVRRKVKHPKQIILINGYTRCLPELPEATGLAAEKMLRRLGVDVRHSLRVTSAKAWFDQTGATKIDLNDNTTLIADLYIPCTGVTPNTAYAPAHLRDAEGYILTDSKTLRVNLAGPRTFAVGDCANYSHNYVPDVYAAVPVAMQNLLKDLRAYERSLDSWGDVPDQAGEETQDVTYDQRIVDSLLCPISRYGGVGILLGTNIPRLVVHLLKGHDYRVCKAKNVVVNGGNPYAVKDRYQ